MAATASGRGSVSVFRRALRGVAIYDVLVLAAHLFVFTWMGFTDLRVALATTLVRVLLWIGFLWLLLAPARDWRRSKRADDQALLAAELALRQVGRRFTNFYVATWMSCQALWVGLAYAGVPSPLPVGRPELLTAACLIFAQLLSPLVLGSILDGQLSGIHGRLRLWILERGHEVPQRPGSIPRAVARLCAGSGLTVLVGMAGLGNHWRIEGLRDAALAEVQGLALASAARIDGDQEPLPGVTIVDALPTELVDADLGVGIHRTFATGLRGENEGENEGVAIYEVRRARAHAAVPLAAPVSGATRADRRWALASAAVDEELGPFAGMLLLLALLGTPIVALGGWAYGWRLAAPIDAFADAAARFVERGQLADLTKLVPVHDDEVARLSRSFNGLVDMLGELAAVTERVADGELNVTLTRPGQLQDAFRAMLAQLAGIVARLRETSVELASAAAEIQALTQAQDHAAKQQAAGVEQIGSTVASLSNAARDIAGRAREVLVDAERTQTMNQEMDEQIGVLRRHAASVTELLEVIHEIADRSDLLALNGSLEAVRAGEAGRGFALVAAEMRRLAERVTGTVDDVRARVTDIERSGARTVLTTARSLDLSQRTAEAARGIATLTERQEADTEAAAAGVVEVVAVVVEGTRALSQLRDAAEGLRAHAQALEQQIEVFELGAASSGPPGSAKT